MHKTHNITETEWNVCKRYFNYECAYCGMTEEEHKLLYNEQLHKEHVINNGSNKLDNCIPACKSCNSSKHYYDIDEWYNTNNPIYNRRRYNKIKQWMDKMVEY